MPRLGARNQHCRDQCGAIVLSALHRRISSRQVTEIDPTAYTTFEGLRWVSRRKTLISKENLADLSREQLSYSA